MAELSDTSTARISIVRQAGKNNTVPSTPAFLNLPITSGGLTEQLEFTDSAVLRPDRQYSNTRPLTGSSGGDLPLEASYGSYMDTLILAVIQSTQTTWAVAAPVFNAKTKHYFSIEKFFEADDGGYYQWFKDQQVNSLTFNFDSNAFLGATVNFMGLEVDPPATSGKTGATYTDPDMDNQFDTNSVSVVIKDDQGAVIETEMQSGSLEMTNSLRKQAAVGKFFGAGNASSRFGATLNGTLYFANRKIYQGFKGNKSFTAEVTFTAPDGAAYKAVMANCKANTYNENIGGVDTDIMIEVSFRGLGDGSTPSRTITWTKTDPL